MKTNTTPTIPDPYEAILGPGLLLCAVVGAVPTSHKMSLRMLNHWTRVCIGDAAVPAMGRGSTRRYSLVDATLLVVGLHLVNDLHLAPTQTHYCVDAVKDCWDELFPGGYVEFYSKFPETPNPKPRFLVASGWIPGHFDVKIFEEKKVISELRNVFPSVVYDVGTTIPKTTSYFISWLNNPLQHL